MNEKEKLIEATIKALMEKNNYEISNQLNKILEDNDVKKEDFKNVYGYLKELDKYLINGDVTPDIASRLTNKQFVTENYANRFVYTFIEFVDDYITKNKPLNKDLIFFFTDPKLSFDLWSAFKTLFNETSFSLDEMMALYNRASLSDEKFVQFVNRIDYEDEKDYNTQFNLKNIKSVDELNKYVNLDMLINEYKNNNDINNDINNHSEEINNSANYILEVVDNDNEVPYISGYNPKGNIDVDDFEDLSEIDLWSIGWTASVQNIEDGPFNTFDDMEISCFDSEQGNEYDLPNIPDKIKDQYLDKVNLYINNQIR